MSDKTNQAHPFGNRPDDLAAMLKRARVLTEASRRYNSIQLAKKAHAKNVAHNAELQRNQSTVVRQASRPIATLYR